MRGTQREQINHSKVGNPWIDSLSALQTPECPWCTVVRCEQCEFAACKITAAVAPTTGKAPAAPVNYPTCCGHLRCPFNHWLIRVVSTPKYKSSTLLGEVSSRCEKSTLHQVMPGFICTYDTSTMIQVLPEPTA
jgi:hypothetical protein